MLKAYDGDETSGQPEKSGGFQNTTTENQANMILTRVII